MANMNVERLVELRMSEGTADPEEIEQFLAQRPAETPRERFLEWMESAEILGLPAVLRHLTSFWENRDRPNVVLLHFDDLKADLESQMRYLAGRLGVTVDEARWPELVRAATFDRMKARAATLAPENSLWIDRNEFFHRGTSGQWREVLDAADVRRYERRVRELVAPELSDWLHRGPIVR